MDQKRSRRSFFTTAATAGAAIFAAPVLLKGSSTAWLPDADKPFRMRYAPSIGMFRELCGSTDPVDNIKFMHDHGLHGTL